MRRDLDRARLRVWGMRLGLALAVPLAAGCGLKVNGSYGNGQISGNVTGDGSAGAVLVDRLPLPGAPGTGPQVAGGSSLPGPKTTSESATGTPTPPKAVAVVETSPGTQAPGPVVPKPAPGPEPDLKSISADQARIREIEAEMPNAGGRDGARLNEELQMLRDRLDAQLGQWGTWNQARKGPAPAPDKPLPPGK